MRAFDFDFVSEFWNFRLKIEKKNESITPLSRLVFI